MHIDEGKKIVVADYDTHYAWLENLYDYPCIHCTVYELNPTVYKTMQRQVREVVDKYGPIYALYPDEHFMTAMGFKLHCHIPAPDGGEYTMYVIRNEEEG